MRRIVVVAVTKSARDEAASLVPELALRPRYVESPDIANLSPPEPDYYLCGWQDDDAAIDAGAAKLAGVADVFVYDGFAEGLDSKAGAAPASEFLTRDPDPGEKITAEASVVLAEKKAEK